MTTIEKLAEALDAGTGTVEEAFAGQVLRYTVQGDAIMVDCIDDEGIRSPEGEGGPEELHALEVVRAARGETPPEPEEGGERERAEAEWAEQAARDDADRTDMVYRSRHPF